MVRPAKLHQTRALTQTKWIVAATARAALGTTVFAVVRMASAAKGASIRLTDASTHTKWSAGAMAIASMEHALAPIGTLETAATIHQVEAKRLLRVAVQQDYTAVAGRTIAQLQKTKHVVLCCVWGAVSAGRVVVTHLLFILILHVIRDVKHLENLIRSADLAGYKFFHDGGLDLS